MNQCIWLFSCMGHSHQRQQLLSRIYGNLNTPCHWAMSSDSVSLLPFIPNNCTIIDYNIVAEINYDWILKLKTSLWVECVLNMHWPRFTILQCWWCVADKINILLQNLILNPNLVTRSQSYSSCGYHNSTKCTYCVSFELTRTMRGMFLPAIFQVWLLKLEL